MPHTPGPWTAGEEFCINPRPIGDGRRYDGLIPVGFAFVMDSARDRKEVIANQNLMAAAPELLEALEELERILDGPIADSITGDVLAESGAYTALTNARAAIAKAKGE